MLNCTFQFNSLIYYYSGKFEAPSNDWIHMTRSLNELELFLVTEGTLFIADSENKYTVSKDEYLIMQPTQKQYGYAPSNCSFFWLHFSAPFVELSVQSNFVIPSQSKIINLERIIILFNQMQDTDRRYHNRVTNDLLATGILMELFNQLQSQQRENSLSSKTQLYQAIIDYIAYNKLNGITVYELAQYFGYHDKYLSSVFKRIAGVSLKQYLLQELMEHAKAELMNSNKTIAQIAYSLGYSDGHNFSHSFKNVVGLSPKEYRISCSKIPKTP